MHLYSDMLYWIRIFYTISLVFLFTPHTFFIRTYQCNNKTWYSMKNTYLNNVPSLFFRHLNSLNFRKYVSWNYDCWEEHVLRTDYKYWEIKTWFFFSVEHTTELFLLKHWLHSSQKLYHDNLKSSAIGQRTHKRKTYVIGLQIKVWQRHNYPPLLNQFYSNMVTLI